MFGSIRRRLVLAQVLVLPTSSRPLLQVVDTTDLGLRLNLGFYLHNAHSLLLCIKSFSTETISIRRKQLEECSFTVSYLVNSCGLSLETAKSVSKSVKIKSATRPDSVLRMLKSHGFSSTHITKLVKSRPGLLLAHPERSILPKLEFFRSIGVTNANLAGVCCSDPAILQQSLQDLTIPNYKFLKTVLLSDEMVVKVIRRKSWIFHQNCKKKVSPKFAILRELGVPESSFPLILTCYTSVVLQRSDQFVKNVKKAIEMGFDPKRWTFIQALHTFSSTSPSTRERKSAIFRRWGWSDDELSLAFRRYPHCMNVSENKTAILMDLLVNKMGWGSSDIVKYPEVLLMNVEKRIIPRCLVIKVLQSKGLVKKNMSLHVAKMVEKKFLDRFVTKYISIVPQLLDVYQRKESVEALNIKL